MRRRRSSHLPSLLLVAIVLAGGSLRVWNHDYDLPTSLTYDSGDKVQQSMRVAEGDLRPLNWKQPYFLIYAAGAVLSSAAGHDTISATRRVTLFMVGLSTATIFLTYLIGVQVFRDRATGLLGAGLLAVVPISVVGARYIKEDTPLMFFCALTLYAVSRASCTNSRRWFYVSWLCVGLAAGTKFIGLLLFVPVLVAWTAERETGWPNWRHLLPAPFLTLLGFLIFNPFVLANPGDFAAGLSMQAGYSQGGHHDGTQIRAIDYLWTYYLRYGLVPGLTLPVCVLGVLGWLHSTIRARENRHVWPLLIWIALYYIVLESSPAKPYPFFARLLHPLVPAFLVLAARELIFWCRRWAVTSIVVSLAVGLLLAWPLAKSVLITQGLKRDTRFVAKAWIDGNLPRGSRIACDDPFYCPRPRPDKFQVKYYGLFENNRVYDATLEELSTSFDYLLISSFKYDRFEFSRPNPDVDVAVRFYERSMDERALEHEIQPDREVWTYGFHNPTLRIVNLSAWRHE